MAGGVGFAATTSGLFEGNGGGFGLATAAAEEVSPFITPPEPTLPPLPSPPVPRSLAIASFVVCFLAIDEAFFFCCCSFFLSAALTEDCTSSSDSPSDSMKGCESIDFVGLGAISDWRVVVVVSLTRVTRWRAGWCAVGCEGDG